MSENTLSGLDTLPEITEIENTFPEICHVETDEVKLTESNKQNYTEKENNNTLINKKINELLNSNNQTEITEEQQCSDRLINEKINEILNSVELIDFNEESKTLKNEDNKLIKPFPANSNKDDINENEDKSKSVDCNEPTNALFSKDNSKEFSQLKHEYLEAREGLKYASNYIACLEYNSKKDKNAQEIRLQQIIAGHENQISNLTVLFLEYLYRLKWNSERKIHEILQKSKHLENKLNNSDAQCKQTEHILQAVNTEKENLVKKIATKEKLIKNLKNKFAKAAKETTDLHKELDDAKNCFGLFLKKHNTELQAYDEQVLKTMMKYLLQMYQVRNKVVIEVSDAKKFESKDNKSNGNGKTTDKKPVPKKPVNTKTGKKGNLSRSSNRSGSVNNGNVKAGAAGGRSTNNNNNNVKLVTQTTNPPTVVKTFTTKIVH